MKHLSSISCISLALILASCSNFDDPVDGVVRSNDIVATHADTPTSRTSIDGDPADGVVGILWTDGDRLGVFDATGANHTLYQKEGNTDAAKAIFSAKEGNITPHYAYYPYSSDNDGRAIGSLVGTLPATHAMEGNNIDGDYKYGTANSTADNGAYYFEFRHIFSLVKVQLDAAGSRLAGDRLLSVEVIAQRGAEPVGIVGGFTFDARNGSYTAVSDASNSLTMTWESTPELTSTLSGYVSVFPTVRIGDKLTFKVRTDSHIATFTASVKVNFVRENLYLFPLTLSRFETSEYDYVLTDPEGNLIDTPTEPSTLTGTFTAATYNVDGLPNKVTILLVPYTVNGDGPGSDGTRLLSSAIANSNWDIFSVSEDFEYNDELTSLLGSIYNWGTFRKPGDWTKALTGTLDTDGLNLFWKKNAIESSNETIVEFKEKSGGLTSGANECIKKGFRRYTMTLADGVEIDVYITHMNTYSDSNTGHINAQHAQLEQLRNYVIADIKANKRPAIIMGDTNMRYTRHKLKELLIDRINAESDLTITDPWVSLAWNNDFSSVGGSTYPAYPSNSLMVSDATGTNDTDIIISEADGGLQKGEVVDKVFYINCRDAKTQIKAKSYLRDVSYKKADGSPLADHYPIVVEFEYTTAN